MNNWRRLRDWWTRRPSVQDDLWQTPTEDPLVGREMQAAAVRGSQLVAHLDFSLDSLALLGPALRDRALTDVETFFLGAYLGETLRRSAPALVWATDSEQDPVLAVGNGTVDPFGLVDELRRGDDHDWQYAVLVFGETCNGIVGFANEPTDETAKSLGLNMKLVSARPISQLYANQRRKRRRLARVEASQAR